MERTEVVLDEPDGRHYEGGYLDGRYDGQGKLIYPDGCCYEGEFRNGCIEGQGRSTYPNGEYYEGGFHNDEFHGRGIYHYPNGDRLECEFEEDAPVGPGMVLFADGSRFEGEFSFQVYPDGHRGEISEKSGRGIFTDKGGNRHRAVWVFEWIFDDCTGTSTVRKAAYFHHVCSLVLPPD